MPVDVELAHLLAAADWRDYGLLDSGDGHKLEQVGPYRFVRPDPQAFWSPANPIEAWQADAWFSSAKGADEDAGRWRFARALPEKWPIQWQGLSFLARATPFRHLAFFPEHSVHWSWLEQKLTQWPRGERPAEVLNLFGYTGLASLAAARAGARVTHVDASRKSVGWARENQAQAGLSDAPIRWIVEDAMLYCRRELNRGRRYDAIILDPPKFGRGPNGETWELETGLNDLLGLVANLLTPKAQALGPRAVITTVYAVRLSHAGLARTLAQALGDHGGRIVAGDMGLAETNGQFLPCAIYARWEG